MSQRDHPSIPSEKELAALPPGGGPQWNRLVFEKSPYLQQHAANPVDWYPWGDEAFEAARTQGKPVFLSVGYATCHWCHVMERESFEDPEVAALMNASFIAVKVDREERPDIDQVFMSVTQAMTGGGGWPMTVVLTPDKRPFFAGTYFPKSGGSGRPGMMQLLPALADAWRTQRDQVAEQADAVVEAMREREARTPGVTLGVETLHAAYRMFQARFDTAYAGFGSAPKFPIPHNLRFLLRYHHRTGEPGALAMVTTTLEKMREGGIFDQVGFGFHRYSTDPAWLLPHFEKMLYDQALLTLAYVEAWQVTGNPSFRKTAEEVLEYVLRDLRSPEGAFYSAEDADSEGEEGLFYLWTPEEITGILGPEEGALFIESYRAEEGGNFVDQATRQKTGRSILHLSGPIDARLAGRLEAGRRKLFEERERRVRPLLDDKILTDWNGLMISALATAGRVFDRPDYVAAADLAASFVLRELRSPDGRLQKRWRQGEAAFYATLEDYAFFIGGLLDLYEATFRPRVLEDAVALTEDLLAHFEDPGGGFYLSPDDGEALFLRSKDAYDGAIPSGNSAAAFDLIRLARLTGRPDLEQAASKTLTVFSGEVARSPIAYTHMLLTLDFLAGPAFEVVVAGRKDAEDTQSMLSTLQAPFLPNKVVLFLPEGKAEEVNSLAPFTRGQESLNGKATAYVCRNFACSLPTNDPAIMMHLLRVSEK